MTLALWNNLNLLAQGVMIAAFLFLLARSSVSRGTWFRIAAGLTAAITIAGGVAVVVTGGAVSASAESRAADELARAILNTLITLGMALGGWAIFRR